MAYRKRPRSPVASALYIVSRVAASATGRRKSARMSSSSSSGGAVSNSSDAILPPPPASPKNVMNSSSTGSSSSMAFAAKTKNKPSRELISIYSSMSRITDIHAAARDPTSHASVQQCLEVMKAMDVTHLGLSQSYVESCRFSQCFPICTETNFELAVFIIPAGRRLKLHDHPGMAVASKLLHGSVQVDSFTQEGEVTPQGIPVGPRVTETKTQASGPWSLSVNEKNYHEFTALTNCAIFDIIFPPYHEYDRLCTYYDVCETASGSLYLKPTAAPSDGPVNMG